MCWRGCGNTGTLAMLPMGIMIKSQCRGSSKTTKPEIQQGTATPLPHTNPGEFKGESCVGRYLYARVQRSSTHDRQKVGVCPSTDTRHTQTNHTHTVGYSSALKRKEIPTQTTAWMNLEDITLSDISQPQKKPFCIAPLLRPTQSRQLHRHRRQSGGCQGLGGGRKGERQKFPGYRVWQAWNSVLQDESPGDGLHSSVNILKYPLCIFHHN